MKAIGEPRWSPAGAVCVITAWKDGMDKGSTYHIEVVPYGVELLISKHCMADYKFEPIPMDSGEHADAAFAVSFSRRVAELLTPNLGFFEGGSHLVPLSWYNFVRDSAPIKSVACVEKLLRACRPWDDKLVVPAEIVDDFLALAGRAERVGYPSIHRVLAEINDGLDQGLLDGEQMSALSALPSDRHLGTIAEGVTGALLKLRDQAVPNSAGWSVPEAAVTVLRQAENELFGSHSASRKT